MKTVALEGNNKRAAKLDKKWRGDVVFFPSSLDESTLVARYRYMWGKAAPKRHGASVVLPAGEEDLPNSYRFFYAYFFCGHCPPFSDFFEAMMVMYGFHLLDFTQMQWCVW